MNKQEQIEKMARVMCEGDTPYGDEGDKINCNECPCYKNKQCELYQKTVTSLMQAGYINGADFVKVLKAKMHEDNIEQLCQDGAVDEEYIFDCIDEALQEYLKGE